MTATATRVRTGAELPTGTEADEARDTYQAALVAQYQQALAVAGGVPRDVSMAGQQALADLLADLDRLLRFAVNGHLSKRFSGSSRPDIFDDCLAEARAACVNALGTYDSSRGKFRTWVMSSRGGAVTSAIRAAALACVGQSWLTQGEEIVARYAHAVRSDLRAGGMEPSTEAIHAETLRRCQAWAADRVDDLWARQGREMPAESDTEAWSALDGERDAQVRAKLSKDGTLKALRGDLAELLAQTETAVLVDTTTVDMSALLDAPRELDSTADAALGGGLGPLSEVAVCGMSDSDREAVWSHLAGEGASPTRPVGEGGQTAASLRAGRAQVGELLAQSKALLEAPHAHFAALSPTLGLQFDICEPAADARGALVAAVRRARLDG